jgi:hypothetical protein
VAYIIGGKEADAQERSDGGRARIYATCWNGKTSSLAN